MNKSEQKAELREELLERRKQLSPEVYREGSARITEHLIHHSYFKQAESVHCYFSIRERKEVDTTAIRQNILQDGKRLVVPVMKFSPPRLYHVEPDSIDNMEPNDWGVPEPIDGTEVSPAELDLVIVPMVGGDRKLNRIGYGKGFYDRFLQEVDCPVVGLCFGTCIIDEIPSEKFDVKMDKIVTESGIMG